MATFSVRFLGCKVSHSDAQALRERLIADGHQERAEGADVAVVNTCCVTHEAVSKSRQAASRAARTHQRVYVTTTTVDGHEHTLFVDPTDETYRVDGAPDVPVPLGNC